MRLIVFCFTFTLFFISTKLNAQIKVFGYVVEISTGEPVENAVIFVNDDQNISISPAIRDTTDAIGYYEIEIPNGTYHIGVYAPYEINGESYVMVYIPGIFDLPVSGNVLFLNHGLKTDFGISESQFRFLYTYPTPENVTFSNDPTYKLQMSYKARMELSRSRVRTLGEPYFKSTPITYIEKKTW